MQTNYSLYNLIKQKSQEKGRPLKVICDWDEVLQPLRPLSFYKFVDTNVPFKEYFDSFWERVTIECSFEHGNKITAFENPLQQEKIAWDKFMEMKKENRERSSKIYDDRGFYTSEERFNAPMLSIAEQLSKLIEEDYIEELFVVSSNSREGKGAQGKRDKFAKTLGKFPNARIKVWVDSKERYGGRKPHRYELIRDDYPDFDIFIDDNDYTIKTTKGNHPKDKIYVLPDYKFSRSLQAPNIYHVKTTVSDIQPIHFAIGALEYRTKKLEQGISALKQKQKNRPNSSTPTWLIIIPIISGVLALLAWIVIWKRKKINFLS